MLLLSNGTYTVSVYAYNPNEAVNIQLYYDGAYRAFATVAGSSSSWVRYSTTFTTTGGAQTIEVHLWGNTTGVWYDATNSNKILRHALR